MWGPPAVLTGKRVRLRPFVASDITDRHVAWLNDPRVVCFSEQRFRRHDHSSCKQYLASFTNTDNLFISVRDLESDAAVGTMTGYVVARHRTVDMGILIGDPTVWGRGYGRDAWETLMNWLFDQQSIRKVTGGSLAANQRMVRLMKQSGMSLEATLRAQEIMDGAPQDVVIYARFNRR